MAGALLPGLFDPEAVVPAQGRLDLFAAVTEDDDPPCGTELVCGVEHMRQQWFAGERMKNLRQTGTHPFTETRGQYHDT